MIKLKNQLGFTLPIAILIVVVLIVAGGAGYYFYKTSQEQIEETADWKVYRDEQNEWYELKYPPNWTVQFGTVGLGSTVTFSDSRTSVFKVWTAPNWDGFLVEEWWDEKARQDEQFYQMTYIKKDSITVGGVRALVFQANVEPQEEHYVFTKGPGIYDISAVAGEKTINQILSTFKFIGEESEAVQPPKEEIIEITGKVNVMDSQVELVSKDGTGYVLQTHPVLVYVFDLSNIRQEDYLESMKGVRDVTERRANLWGISKILVRTAQFPMASKLVIEPMIDPADLAENFIDEFLKLIGKTPYLEFRLEEKAIMVNGTYLPAFLEWTELDFDPETNKPVINLKFDKEREQILEELFSKNIGKQLDIYLDGILIYSFIIQSSTPAITGDFTTDEAKQIVRFLNAGALPIPIKLISQQNKINMEELQKLHGKTILVKGYLPGEEAIKKTIYVISFETK